MTSKRGLLALVTVAVTSIAGAASAEVPVGAGSRIFQDHGLGSVSTGAAEAAAVERGCTFSVMSREGPDPRQAAACDAAVARLERRGAAAAPAILAALDRNVGWNAKQRLYHALARTGDARAIEPLIRGMARIATRRLEGREWEAGMIDDALDELTRARVTSRAPWVDAPVRSPEAAAVDRAVDWRIWHEEHRGLSHAELAEERLADAREHAEDPDPARAYEAVHYLLRYSPSEGIDLGRKLLARDDLPHKGRRPTEWQVERAQSDIASVVPPPPARKGRPRAAKAPPPAAPAQAPAEQAPLREVPVAALPAS